MGQKTPYNLEIKIRLYDVIKVRIQWRFPVYARPG